MSIEQLDVIDDLHMEGETGPVVLTILDPLDWSDPASHKQALQQKINVYLAFVESGEMFRDHPEVLQRPVVIHVASKFEPDPDALLFFAEARTALAAAGFGFSHEVLDANS